MNLSAALEYGDKHGGHALLVGRGDALLLERYAAGHDAQTSHPIYSGTKSFWGALAVCAQSDGVLRLEDRVSECVPWNGDERKARVTLRMLLDLTAGFGFGGLGNAVPPYAKALTLPLKNEPGTTFAYGGIALQVFGAALSAKIAPLTPHEYLRERLLEPAGVTVARWRTLRDGTHPLPTGAFLTARSWLAYGRHVLRERASLRACFVGSAANPRYGLGWWLRPPGAEPDVVYASGAAGQALYLIPALDAVVVRFGKSASYKHDALLKRLFSTERTSLTA